MRVQVHHALILSSALLCGACDDASAPAAKPGPTAGSRPAEGGVPPDAPPTAAPPATCEGKAEAMSTRMHEGCASGQKGLTNLDGPPAPEGLEMPWHLYAALDVTITAETYTVSGEDPDETLDAFWDHWLERAAMKEALQEAKGMDGAPVRWRISAPADLPADRVTSLLERFEKEGYVDGAFVFRGGDIAPYVAQDPKYHEELQRKMDAAPPDQRSMTLAEEAKVLVAGCTPVMEAFKAVAMAAPDARCEAMVRGTAKGLAECDCAVDPAKLETFLGATMKLADEKFWSIPVHVRLSVAGEWLELAPGGSWGDAVSGVDWVKHSDPVEPHRIWMLPKFERLPTEEIEPKLKTCVDDKDVDACRELCRNEVADGCGWWSSLSTRGDRTRRDIDRSDEIEQREADLRERSCREEKDAEECGRVAMHYEVKANGLTSPSYDKSHELRVLGCELGHDYSCNAAARRFELRRKTPENLRKARAFYDIACLRDYESACKAIAKIDAKLEKAANE